MTEQIQNHVQTLREIQNKLNFSTKIGVASMLESVGVGALGAIFENPYLLFLGVGTSLLTLACIERFSQFKRKRFHYRLNLTDQKEKPTKIQPPGLNTF